MKCTLVAYYRVSTDRQGRSGLGLEAQQAAIASHVAASGCHLIASYTEVETGKRDDLDNRPELLRAIAHARRAKATLVIAKLDRLARSVAVVSMLHTSGVEFVCCDNPAANRLTVQILAAVAENEARLISERTRAALSAYKARGGVLGAARPECRTNLSAAARREGARAAGQTHAASASAAYTDLKPYVSQLRQTGLSLRGIAARLTAEGHTTRRNRPWNPVQVSRLLRTVG